MTKKEKEALRCHLNLLAEALDNQYKFMEGPTAAAHYDGMIRAFERLGGDWSCDENGHHRIFLFGIRGEAEVDE